MYTEVYKLLMILISSFFSISAYVICPIIP